MQFSMLEGTCGIKNGYLERAQAGRSTIKPLIALQYPHDSTHHSVGVE